jgi:UDP-N-acetylmuramate--alanine ligase
MVAAMLDAAGLDPTVINGGIINAYGTNARLGAGEWMVVEADESDGTFVRLPATIAIITNIDPEHLDHYGDFEAEKAAFLSFANNIPFYGFACLCLDHPEVQALIPRLSDRRVVTYGMNPQAEIRADEIKLSADGSRYDVTIAVRGTPPRVIEGARLPMLGAHNIQNSLAAIAVANELGLDDRIIRTALAGFSGVKRRFTRTGIAHGITVIDDYGHHPVEIRAVLRAARGARPRRVIAVCQPHRFTRLQSLFEEFCTCFNDADAVVVADVYAAGETAIAGIDRDALVAGIRARGHREVHALEKPEALTELVHRLARPGDMVVCLGAGSITNWAHALPDDLARLGPPTEPEA